MATPAAAPTPSHPAPRRSPLARAAARRHNPLWRQTDTWRSRIRLLLVLGLTGAAALSALFALAHYQDNRTAAQRTAATLHQVRAVALSDADQLHPGLGSTFTAQVRWTAANGTVQQARAGVDATTATGDHVTVWLDHKGQATAAPTSASDSAANAILLGLLALSTSTIVLLAGDAFARARMANADLRRWDQDWERTAPGWTSRR
jgi:hypothetical protein